MAGFTDLSNALNDMTYAITESINNLDSSIQACEERVCAKLDRIQRK